MLPAVADPITERGDLPAVLAFAAAQAEVYLAQVGDSPVLPPDAEQTIDWWDDPMPEEGDGSLVALAELAERASAAATRSCGPRFFHFVMGGSTPAALGADWLTSAYDQIAFAWASSPFAATMERVSLGWLCQLFELPDHFGGVLTTGATMANYVGLAAARNWWGERCGVDVDEQGLTALPAPTVLSSGYVHASAVQAIGMLGIGRAQVRRLVADDVGRLDLAALEASLAATDGRAIVIANAGEVNAGDFDPIAAIADLVEQYGGWLHVDGAFGLFARLSPATRHLTYGVERADSIAVDGHKWLNVPYDCGIALVRQLDRLPRALNVGAPYLPRANEIHPSFGFLAPENSRRARALAVWATLRAYGRAGYRQMIERHVRLARRLADRVDHAATLERLADGPLNIVCFRARPPGLNAEQLDQLNRRLGQALIDDGRVFAGTTVYAGKVALRPAIVNWQTSEPDVDLLVDVVCELAERLGHGTG
jgi:glutamate/tyrosine decarboxylase-like PLP-dependent enzyme